MRYTANALQLCPDIFHTYKLCSKLSSSKVRFERHLYGCLLPVLNLVVAVLHDRLL